MPRLRQTPEERAAEQRAKAKRAHEACEARVSRIWAGRPPEPEDRSPPTDGVPTGGGDGGAREEKPTGKQLVVHEADKVDPESIEWIWPGRIAVGKTTLIGGDPGLG